MEAPASGAMNVDCPATAAGTNVTSAARRLLRGLGLLALGLAACSEPPVARLERQQAGPGWSDPAKAEPGAGPQRATPALELLDRHESGQFDRGAAEIVHYHAGTRRVFVVNARAGRVTVLELGARGFRPGERVLEPRRDILHFDAGQVTSLAVAGDLVAVAVRAAQNDERGRVAFYSATDLRYLGAASVGFGPDMLTFTPDGQTLLVANEGEQVRSAEQRIVADPAGSVSILDVSRGVERVRAEQAGFEA
ncbi:MAG TPA: hypothetical protein VMG12_26550, partial [Polyangiaceae bacterium]|nr:hypothetical protein [Polyangiaceae bacterium]